MFSCGAVAAPPNCIDVDAVAKWEVISSNKLLAYDKAGQYLAFVGFFNCPGFSQSENISIRFFSPSICSPDNVMIKGSNCRVGGLEPVRKN